MKPDCHTLNGVPVMISPPIPPRQATRIRAQNDEPIDERHARAIEYAGNEEQGERHDGIFGFE